METFIRGSDLVMLKALLGAELDAMLPSELLAWAYEEALRGLAQYDDAGLSVGGGPEAGRTRPHNVPQSLCGLAAPGFRGAAEEAERVLGLWRRVPEDSTCFTFDDREELPLARYTQLQACAVGTQMVAWYRNCWRLRASELRPGNEGK